MSLYRPYLSEQIADIPSPYLLAAQAELNAASVEAWRQGRRVDVDPADVTERALELWDEAKEAAVDDHGDTE